MKTHVVREAEVERQWHVLDAKDKPLGRLATEAAMLLKGKHKPTYTPNMDMGDYVIVVNAAHVQLTGKKRWQKVYYRHSQYPGGLRAVSFETMLRAHPIRVIEHAVKGMLPHNRLGEGMFKKLKVYPSEAHPHQAQLVARPKQASSVSVETAETASSQEQTGNIGQD
jgi:large subunit ribosomal protein L13